MIKITKYISIIERCGILYRNNAFKDLGLSGCHQMYIFYLCRCPGVSQDQLAKELHINKSNVARSLKCLETSGFVEIKNDIKDGRVNRVYPTEKANNILPVVSERIRSWNETLLEGFSEEEKELVDNILKRLARNAIKQDIPEE